ncbi:PAS domain S-box [Pseudomonas sp. GM74]|uniref:PAS domain-containing protein n=1 Tax=Pseudomonas sp. GM74 TaxID=1144336 RepID=UPI000270745B|nr:PAS domain-containing protein [Pseudomonas sp. GM74]EJM80834.1 PAS domain S-box [Pseudomonas sp. GM74]
MSAGDKLFGRLLHRHPPPPPEPPEALRVHSFGLQMQLNAEGRVVQLSGPLRHLLAQQPPGAQAPHLLDFLLPHSSLAIEGSPADWQGQTLDLDFYSLNGPPLHLRGWVQPLADAWLLQMLDISDLLLERRQSRNREQCQVLALQIAGQLHLSSLTRLPEMLAEQLQSLAQRFQIPCIALALLDEQEQGWQIYQHYVALDAPQLWQNGQRLGTGLDSLSGSAPQHLTPREHPRLQGTFGNTDGFAVPYHDAQGVVAWLLCGFYTAQQRAPDITERDWLQITAALASPLLERLREHRHHLQLERLESLQALLGTGWWEVLSDSDEVQLAPSLATTLKLGTSRLSMQDWLDQVYPADREELRICLQDLQETGTPLLLCVRLYRHYGAPDPIWYRLQGQALGAGKNRRLVGFMLDISDIKNQEQSAAAARARLDNLIASSPAVIYVQRYVEGTLQPVFFSDSLLPLLGWTLADCAPGALVERVHPDDRLQYFERTRQLLREGSVRARYRLRDSRGDYHWLLDEAKLLRDDLGLPVEAVGLWLDVTDATLATEQVRQSEERYRILVEDSPAMICRYQPDLTLTFGNRPLATYLEMAPEQLPGVNLGDWMSGEQREAFTRRLNQLSPEFPVSTAEINLQLPGREHAWWVWSDRGVFDEQGRLLEVQAVGRDNTEVQRAARVVDHMRVFGRSEIEQQPFNPAQAIEGTLSLLSEGMRGKGVDLRISEPGFEVQVRGYVDQLEQVLINLMVNARDALLGKREANPDFKPWISVYAERDTHSVRLWVEDNGGGIDPRLLERIFEPLFTTKPVGVGTGLSVSYGIVENMGGKLSVQNATEGARFCIELPIVLPH